MDVAPRLDEIEDFNDFVPSFVETFRAFDDSIVALPNRVVGGHSLFYRKDLFEEYGVKVPTNLDEMIDAAQALTIPDKEIYGMGILGKQTIHLVMHFIDFANVTGGSMIGEDLKHATCNEPPAVEALQAITDIVQKYKVAQPGVLTHTSTELQSLVFDGKIAMVFFPVQYRVFYQNPESSKVVDKMFIAPHPFDAGVKPKSFFSEWGLFINKFGEHTEEAWEFVKWITNSPNQIYEAKKGNGPSRFSVVEHPDYAALVGEENMEVFKQTMEISDACFPPLPRKKEMWEILTYEASAAVSGQKKPQEAMDDAAENIDKILGEI
jgi:ABC-type glycerol-3-phosphate transport system substrate-binding protein